MLDYVGMKYNGLKRYLMAHALSGRLPLYIVTEFPKSGGTWFSRMLSEALQIPNPRQRVPRIESCIIHGVYLYSPRLKNVFCLIRDGRDIMVSYYFHSLFVNDVNNSRLVKLTSRELGFADANDVSENLPRFIEWVFTRRYYPRYTWVEFMKGWIYRQDVHIIRYEDLLLRCADVLQSSIRHVCGIDIDDSTAEAIAKANSFQSVAKRNPGSEHRNQFLRKGISGDWKNYFNREAIEIFNYYGGPTLIDAGYEQDDSWTTRTNEMTLGF